MLIKQKSGSGDDGSGENEFIGPGRMKIRCNLFSWPRGTIKVIVPRVHSLYACGINVHGGIGANAP